METLRQIIFTTPSVYVGISENNNSYELFHSRFSKWSVHISELLFQKTKKNLFVGVRDFFGAEILIILWRYNDILLFVITNVEYGNS